MIKPAISRRRFYHASLVSLLAAVAATPADNTTSAQPQAAIFTLKRVDPGDLDHRRAWIARWRAQQLRLRSSGWWLQ